MRAKEIEKLIYHLDKLDYSIRKLLKEDNIPADVRREFETGLVKSQSIRKYLKAQKELCKIRHRALRRPYVLNFRRPARGSA